MYNLNRWLVPVLLVIFAASGFVTVTFAEAEESEPITAILRVSSQDAELQSTLETRLEERLDDRAGIHRVESDPDFEIRVIANRLQNRWGINMGFVAHMEVKRTFYNADDLHDLITTSFPQVDFTPSEARNWEELHQHLAQVRFPLDSNLYSGFRDPETLADRMVEDLDPDRLERARRTLRVIGLPEENS